ncbi:MAG TPA: cytochrome c biogenesis protein CcsA [Chthoniobacteraceae bacterium]|nr:cytochrome c biogenesis protein CcsA [Chthoniobacteraceae bacterium]
MKSKSASSTERRAGKSQSPAAAPRPPERAGWRKWIAWGLVAMFVLEFGNALRAPKDKTFAYSQFAQLPLVFNGRVQPMDSLGRNSLLQIRNTMAVPLEGNAADGSWGEWPAVREKGKLSERNWYQFSKHPKKLKPAEWLLEVMAAPDRADDRYIFAANHPDLVSLLKLEGKGVEKSGLHYFRFNDLKESIELMRAEATRAQKLDQSHRSSFDRAVLQLQSAFFLYLRLKNTIQPQNSQNFAAELADYVESVEPGRAAAIAQQGGQTHDEAALNRLLKHVETFDTMTRMDPPLVVPPHHDDRTQWERTGQALMEVARGGPLQESVRLYASMATAFRTGDVERFNRTVGDYRQHLLSAGFTAEVRKGEREFFFNRMLAFKRAMYIYITAFLLVLAYWFNTTDIWRRAAFWLICLGLVIHTAGLIYRMVLEGRPPVTNLYSSAIFIGWGACVLGLVLERFHRNGIGLAVASAVGFVTLIIAHNLALGGDTMEMMRAVLDTNFWLATHVVVITLGYAATFVAGFLALLYVLRGVFTKTLDRDTAKSLARMVYGIVCFATLFSFVGTVLGGIWADQSWGRFWGWDPKENGALIIVLWNALILHARWGGLVKERGLMNLAIFGNVVTAWSWFGVNMLGIGLHSYGFMDAAFWWLAGFVASQLLIMALCGIPQRFWRSFSGQSVAIDRTPQAA